MVRSAIADEGLLTYLTNLAKPDTCTVGLILGQPTPSRDYIVHFAKTPPCEDETSRRETSLKHIRVITDILDVWVADHAKHATRMLSGGMYVLGIFVVSQDDLLSPFSPKIKSILNRLHKQLAVNKFLCGNPDTSEKLVLNYCTRTQTYACKSYDVVLATAKPADFRFQSKPTKWKQFECKYELDQTFPIFDSVVDLSLKRHMTHILETIHTNLKSAIFAFDGEIKDESEDIDSLDRKKKNNKQVSKESATQISIYLPCDCKDILQPVDIRNYGGHIKLTGQVACKLWLHSKATVHAATAALTQDLIRSLAARLEMHWDSLIEEEHGSPEDTNSIHEPPRRVLVNLPNSDITLSDYLFPGEGPQDAQVSLAELLDVTLTEQDAVKDIEGQADLVDIYNDNLEAENHEGVQKHVADTNRIMYILGLGVAFLVLIASLIIHFFDINF